MDAGTGGNRASIGHDGSVLITAEAFSDGDDAACIDLLSQTPPAGTNVVSVTFDAAPEERVAVWQREYGNPLPANATVVDGRGSTGTVADVSAEPSIAGVDIEVLDAGATLSDIAVSIARQLGVDRDADRTTQLCLHSLSDLTRAFDPVDVAEFVAVLNRLCDRHDIGAHHHVDSSASEELLSMLRPQYDMVAEHTEGGWTISRSERSTVDSDRRQTPDSPGRFWTAPPIEAPVSMRYSFDTVLDLISNPVRRTLLYHLADCSETTHSIEQVTAAVVRRLDALPVRDSRSEGTVHQMLVHAHLPKLADVGVVAVDQSAGTLTYQRNPALEQVLKYVERIELG